MNISAQEQQRRELMTSNAKSMFAFTTGQKVIWVNGGYDHYFIKDAHKEMGVKYYSLTSPIGTDCGGGRVREGELIAHD